MSLPFGGCFAEQLTGLAISLVVTPLCSWRSTR